MADESVVVQIVDGKVKGTVRNNLDHDVFYAFLGIPYAKAPVGDLRFKKSLPVDPWNDLKDATKDGDCCYQRQGKKPPQGSEDCLHLNVFTKSTSKDNLKPVMVFIHGGSFLSGSNKSSMLGPDYLLSEDIVLVSINYRVGILGFLSAEDHSLDISENNGLKDQLLALKWVQRNIEFFGGDPNNVTIFGESAGSACAHYHVLSPQSKGLFHKAILQSGVAVNPWAYGRTRLLEFVQTIGIEVNSDKEALNYLRDLPVEDLYEAQSKYMEIKKESISFRPVIEEPGPDAFIIQEPLDTLTSGNYNHVPMIIGYNDREGIIVVLANKASMEFDKFAKYFAQNFGLDPDSDINRSICQKLWDHYFPEGDDQLAKVLLASDLFFLVGKLSSIRRHSSTTMEPIYFYRMSLDAGLNFYKKKLGGTHIKGACHVDDIGYLFSNSAISPPAKGTLEDISIRRFVKLWTNFACYGNPTPPECDLEVVWKPVDRDSINFLDIGETLTMDIDPEPDRMKVWDEVLEIVALNGGKF